jgi:glycerophosphoryl diester phosphodiesterase
MSELRSVDVGGGESIPSLAEVFELLRSTSLDIQVELKGEGVVKAAVAQSLRFELADRVVFTSFFHRRVLAARRCFPQTRTGVLLSSVPVDIVDVAHRAQANAVHLHHARLSGDVVAEIHSAGLRVVAWGVIKEDADFDRLFGLGVDAIGSDWPSRLLARRNYVFGGQ